MAKDISIEILKYLDFEEGFYIECGAHDGLFMSNTYILETKQNWRGMLIEASPDAYRKCFFNRSSEKNKILNYALVSKNYEKTTIMGDFNGHPMASVDGKRLRNISYIEVPARTITQLLNEYQIEHIDFFSLDVEGYEMEVLEGLDFDKYKPTWFLIEENKNVYDNLREYMEKKKYECIANLSQFTPEEDPLWNGNHQDYLFKLRIGKK